MIISSCCFILLNIYPSPAECQAAAHSFRQGDGSSSYFPQGYCSLPPPSTVPCPWVRECVAVFLLFNLIPNVGSASGKEPTCQCRRHKRGRFDPWVGKIPWRRKWQHTPVFLPGKSHGQRSLAVRHNWVNKKWIQWKFVSWVDWWVQSVVFC